MSLVLLEGEVEVVMVKPPMEQASACLTSEELLIEFERLNREHFDGLLGSGVVVEIMTVSRLKELAKAKSEKGPDIDLADFVHGLTNSKDGSLILINPQGEHSWQCTLVHEMVHSYEARFGDRIVESPDGQAAARWCQEMSFIYELHSARFFSMLFGVMRARGHDPRPGGDDFALYFG